MCVALRHIIVVVRGRGCAVATQDARHASLLRQACDVTGRNVGGDLVKSLRLRSEVLGKRVWLARPKTDNPCSDPCTPLPINQNPSHYLTRRNDESTFPDGLVEANVGSSGHTVARQIRQPVDLRVWVDHGEEFEMRFFVFESKKDALATAVV